MNDGVALNRAVIDQDADVNAFQSWGYFKAFNQVAISTTYIAPYMARLIENSLLSVNPGIVESADAMGATVWQIIWHFILPEAKSSLILSITTATISLLSATAMAGAVGGGGIGDLALNYGYQRFDNFAMALTVITLIIIVQIIQWLGEYLANKARH